MKTTGSRMWEQDWHAVDSLSSVDRRSCLVRGARYYQARCWLKYTLLAPDNLEVQTSNSFEWTVLLAQCVKKTDSQSTCLFQQSVVKPGEWCPIASCAVISTTIIKLETNLSQNTFLKILVWKLRRRKRRRRRNMNIRRTCIILAMKCVFFLFYKSRFNYQ
jgi:hypothetical protein